MCARHDGRENSGQREGDDGMHGYAEPKDGRADKQIARAAAIEPAQQEAQQCHAREHDQRMRLSPRRVLPGILAESKQQRGAQAGKCIAARVDDDAPDEPTCRGNGERAERAHPECDRSERNNVREGPADHRVERKARRMRDAQDVWDGIHLTDVPVHHESICACEVDRERYDVREDPADPPQIGGSVACGSGLGGINVEGGSAGGKR